MGLMPQFLNRTIPPMQALSQTAMDEAVSAIRSRWPGIRPRLGLVLGSGWNRAAEGFDVRDTISYEQIPHLGKTGAPGHAGTLALAEQHGTDLLIFHGRRHLYEGVDWMPAVLPIWILKAIDVKTVLLTNASGGIRDDLQPGSLMAVSDHINLLGGNPLVGPHNPLFGERFPDQSAVYDPELKKQLLDAGADSEGVYVAVSGPTFETPAEIRAFRALGADAVGMSTVPEAIFANALGLKTAALSCISNRAAGLGAEVLSAEDVQQTVCSALPGMRSVLERFIRTAVSAD